MNWHDLLQARLLEAQPESVCALDAAAHELAAGVLPDTPLYRHDGLAGRHCALALGIDALNGLDAQQARQLISQTRLYVAPRILLAVQAGCVLGEEMFRALGFMLYATDSTENMRIHYYDLDTYKAVPDWLNARFWAHPERWEP